MFYPFDITTCLGRLQKLIPLLAFLLALFLFDNSSDALPVQAFTLEEFAREPYYEDQKNKSSEGVLHEVAPPEVVQKIRERLLKYKPKLLKYWMI